MHCEILEKNWAAPPCVSPEKTTGVVAPASACVRAFAYVCAMCVTAWKFDWMLLL
jgi:hypothetical protein